MPTEMSIKKGPAEAGHKSVVSGGTSRALFRIVSVDGDVAELTRGRHHRERAFPAAQDSGDGFADQFEPLGVEVGIRRAIDETHLDQNGWSGRLVEEEQIGALLRTPVDEATKRKRTGHMIGQRALRDIETLGPHRRGRLDAGIEMDAHVEIALLRIVEVDDGVEVFILAVAAVVVEG